jgi:O-antigen/teichoic acid export membrane protein
MIGLERFGIWALFSILTGYFALLDFGIGLSYTRFIAESYTQGNNEEINRIVNSGFVFYSLVSIVILIIAVTMRRWIFSFLNIDERLFPDLMPAYYGTLVIFLFSASLSGFTSVLQGLQKLDIVNKIAVVVTLMNAVATIIFLRSGFRLDGLMWSSAITTTIGLSVSLLFVKRYFPPVRFKPTLFSLVTIKKLLSFGMKLQFSKFFGLITFQADKAIVSFFTGPESVGYYQIGSQIVLRTRDIPVLLLASIIPAASELHARDEQRKLIDVYERGTKYLAAIGIPAMILLAVTTQFLIKGWMGAGYRISGIISQILVAGYLVNALTGVGAATAAGMNRPNFEWHAAIVSIVSNLTLVFLLGKFFGVYGIAVAGTISLVIGAIYFLVHFHKFINIPVMRFLKTTMAYPFIISLYIAIIFWVLNTLVVKRFNYVGRLPNLAVVGVEAVLFLSIYGYAIYRSSFFDEVDKELFLNNYLLSKVRRLFRFV